MYLAALEPEHDPGADDRVPRAGHPAADVDDRGRRRDRRSSAPPTTRCGSGSTRCSSPRAASPPPTCSTAISASNFLVGARQDRERVRRLQHQPCSRRCRRPEAFGALPLRGEGDEVVRLRDVATVELASEEQRGDRHLQRPGRAPSSASSRRRRPTRSTPPRRWSPSCRRSTPACRDGMEIELVYDSTETISASIEEVFKTIAEAVAIVVLVILLFLGSFRSVLMPVVTIPLSLIGVCFVLLRARLLDQPPVAARHGAGDRPRRRRRHRRGREHPPPHRGGADADATRPSSA